MTQEHKDLIARAAASTWSYCYKCDGIVNETGIPCDKRKMHTCRTWYDGYRTALIALGKEEEEKETPSPEEAMKILDEKIALRKKNGSWEGTDAENFGR